ncbi:MAG: PadR family transcriptional regulator [Leptolyngbya sp. BL-A-14]
MALAQAILATLLDYPCSGYDLRKRFEGSVGFFWQASFQQIYRELSKLEEEGWLSAETIHQQHRPDKKVYRVTSEGENQLKAWIKKPCAIAPTKDDLLVKMFSGYTVPTDTFLTELKQHQAQHQERLLTYRHIEQQYFSQPETLPLKEKFRYLTLLNGIRFETVWLSWCEESIALLDASPADEEPRQ